MWRILRRRDHRIRTSTGRHRGGTSGGTLVFTQVRPRPPESFRTHLTSMVMDEPSNVESQQCSRASPHWRGRLIDGWSILGCPSRRSRIVIGGQVGGSIGRTRRPRKLRRLAAVGMSRSTRLRGGPGMSWSARLANSERSTSQAIYATRGKSRGCAPLREFHPIRCPQCGALACKLPATRLLPYAGVRKSLPVRNPYGSEHRRIHQDDHEWRSEWRSNHSLAKRI